jgi:hypothetical protein
MAALEAMDPEVQRPEIEIVEAQQPNLAGAQPVAVGDQEQRTVARIAPRGGEQPGEFVEGEKPASVVLQKFLFTMSLDGEGPAAEALD